MPRYSKLAITFRARWAPVPIGEDELGLLIG
jgi:hypothetical protein